MTTKFKLGDTSYYSKEDISLTTFRGYLKEEALLTTGEIKISISREQAAKVLRKFRK
jgi:hypothetical protein